MNIVCILAGGVGNRFGSPVPKQYHLVNGRPVIEYVINAALKSDADEIIVVANQDQVMSLQEKYGVCVIEGGKRRNDSIQNALDYLNMLGGCDRLVLLEAVCPLVTSELLNLYFSYLDEYDAVFTVSDLTTNLARYDGTPVNRKEFVLVESPDAYRYDVLNKYFNSESSFVTPLHMLPNTAKIYLYKDFKDYIKVVYPHDLSLAETLLREREKRVHFEAHTNDAVLDLFAKLRKMDQKGTRIWEKHLDKDVAELFTRWEIYNYEVNRDAYTGLVLECRSRKYGEVVIKMYPGFLERRFIKESFIMKTLKNYHQAELLDLDVDKRAMLLERVIPGDYVDFESDKQLLITMFRDMQANRLPISAIKTIPSEILGIVPLTEVEYETAKNCGYHTELITYLLSCARIVYDEFFSNDDKFLLHGDAYYKNALHSEKGVSVIDPVGYQDAFIFEFMPMLTYELVMHTSGNEYARKYNELVSFFSGITDTERFNAATFVFLVKQLIPSIYEANDGFVRADRYLHVIQALFLDEAEKLSLNLNV